MSPSSILDGLLPSRSLYLVTHGLEPDRVFSTAQRDELAAALQEGRRQGCFRLLAFVVMPDHWHALLQPAPCPDLEGALQAVIESASLASRRRGEPLPWAQDLHARPLKGEDLAPDVIAYIEANPLRRGWVRRASDWPWSSAHPEYAPHVDREGPSPAPARPRPASETLDDPA